MPLVRRRQTSNGQQEEGQQYSEPHDGAGREGTVGKGMQSLDMTLGLDSRHHDIYRVAVQARRETLFYVWPRCLFPPNIGFDGLVWTLWRCDCQHLDRKGLDLDEVKYDLPPNPMGDHSCRKNKDWHTEQVPVRSPRFVGWPYPSAILSRCPSVPHVSNVKDIRGSQSVTDSVLPRNSMCVRIVYESSQQFPSR